MDVVVPIVFFSVLGALTLYGLTARLPPSERRWLTRLLFLAFGLRMVLATVFALVPEARLFHEDADGYELLGMAIANRWHGAGPPFHIADAANLGHYYICGTVYYLFGTFRPVASYFNALLGAATVFVVYRLTLQFFHIAVARRVALLVALMPSIILWNSLALKDTEVTLLVVLALSSCVSLKRRFTPRALAGVLLPLIALQPIRFYIVYFLGLAIVGSLLFERGTKVLTGVPKILVAVGGGLALLALVGLSSNAREGTSVFDLERVNTFRQGMASTAHSGFAADVDISTPGGALMFLPVGLAVLLLGPFPWQLTALRPLMAAPETIFWWFLIPSAIRGIRFAIKERFADTSPILLFTAILAPAYALVQGNVGSAFRQRAQIFVLLFVFTALGQYLEICRKKRLNPKLLLQGTPPPPAEPPTQAVRA
jgi:4-amino-4-deoxy-L-arabinose transferase-like glycosyltransferase